jgi:AsmA family protein
VAGKRGLKIVGGIVAGIVLLMVLAGAALWFGGTPLLGWLIEHPVSAVLGRQITIGGPLALRWGDPSRIIAEDVRVANADWGSAPEMFKARRLEIDIYLRSLVFGPTHIPLISLEDASLLLETSKDGRKNWDFGASSAAPKKREEFPALRRLLVRQSRLQWRNGKTGAETTLGIDTLDLGEPHLDAPIELAAAGSFQQAPLHLRGTFGPLASLRDPSHPYPVKIEGDLDQVRLAVDGGIAAPLDFNGLDLRLSLAGPRLQSVAAMFGVPLPEMSDFRGTATLQGGEGRWELHALSLKTGKSDLEGGIDVDTNETVPQLTANLTASTIDLGDFKGLYGGKPAHASTSAVPSPAESGGRVLPDTQIAVKRLPGLDAELNFYGTHVIATGGIPIEQIELGVRLKGGELTVKPLRFHAADGDVALNFHFTPYTKNSPPLMQANIDIRRVDLHKLLDRPTLPAMLRPTAGILGGFVNIGTTGVSTRQFLARMNGEAGLFMQNGRISQLLERLAPIDVLGALGVYVTGDKPVRINCLVSDFKITAGLANATTMLLDTDSDIVAGKGEINFGEETLHLNLSPHNKSFTLLSLRTPVDITGTFAKPDFHIETMNLAARVGAAIGLGVVFPPAALAPLIDTGLGEHNACAAAFAQTPPQNQPHAGSSVPPGKPATR